MAFLSEIKSRITSTTDTRKITQSLELVAASKMKSFVRKSSASRLYADGLVKAMRGIVGEFNDSPYSEVRAAGKIMFVLLSSDKGLCGSLNSALSRFLFSHPEWISLPESERILVTIGRKAQDAANRKNLKPDIVFPAIGESMTPLQALDIIDKIVNSWLAGNVKQVYMVSPDYINPFTNTPKLRKYLPISLDMLNARVSPQETAKFVPEPIMEPDADRASDEVLAQVLQAMFLEVFYQLKASEYSSRMVAMKKASDAAKDMIDELTLEYNKTRQAQVTSQLSELAAAGEAQSDNNQGK
jgi:F-type H+-transporting ATPase subunit gamma